MEWDRIKLYEYLTYNGNTHSNRHNSIFINGNQFRIRL
jgi:hypothetical protein